MSTSSPLSTLLVDSLKKKKAPDLYGAITEAVSVL